jgi:hypothetical protein
MNSLTLKCVRYNQVFSNNQVRYNRVSLYFKYLISDIPPWLKSSGGDYDESRPSINSRRKPERRVPITAPPTKPSSFETTTISTTTTARERPRPETPFPDVSAAPVFYENHHVSGNINSETESSRDNFATTKTSVIESSSSSPSLIENQISPQEIFDENNSFEGSTKNGSRLCPARRSRGILWLEVAVGGFARRPCPHGAEAGLQAVWECISGRDSLPVWKSNWPDLSGERILNFFVYIEKFEYSQT